MDQLNSQKASLEANASTTDAACGFNEATNQDYADWKRLRLVIEHENTLVNHRLTWLLTSQTVAFAAIAVIFKEWLPDRKDGGTYDLLLALMILVCLLGFGTALLVSRGLLHAQTHIARLDRWWYSPDRANMSMDFPRTRNERLEERRARMELAQEKLGSHPPLQHQTDLRSDDLLSPSNLPACFMYMWPVIGAILVFVRLAI
ncbi:hypothetical protein P9239_04965 [Caballeronia sp. LZ062]|uniref:hypothetical protein n=1 Tax=unclassified Caballeronia TaxID=2646786 RepID=UPI0028593600|nr:MULTISPECIES: hypothetical protein [unclassified Caballeronia]MDR5856895.1 hypothetical protein [Caballeronia sp. LZ050]MDR5869708.1 hypothetical protein [Caballeronia sp. LZ062]